MSDIKSYQKDDKNNLNSDNLNKKNKKFKMPPTIFIILGILIFVIFLTWIFQGQKVPGTTDTVQVFGLLGIGEAIISGFKDASGIIIYLFVLGWFLETVLKTKSLETGIKSLMHGLKGKEIVLVPLMFLIFSLGGTTFGMQEETLPLFIIIIPIFILAGFDTMTGLMVVLLGTTTGIASSVVNPFSIGTSVNAINSVIGHGSSNPFLINDLTIGTGIIYRIWSFIVLTTVGISFTTFYATRVRKNPEKSFTYETYKEDIIWAKETLEIEQDEEESVKKRQNIALFIFIGTFIFMFLMLIPWTTFIPGMSFKTSPWNSWLLNNFALPGEWDFPQLILLFSFSTIVISMIFKYSPTKILDTFWVGAKDMLTVGLLIGIARGIPHVLNVSHLDLFFAGNIAKGLGGASSLSWTYLMFFVFLAFGLLIPSTSGLSSSVMGVFATSAAAIFGTPLSLINNGSTEQLVHVLSATLLVFSLAIGIVNMIIPTQSVVMLSAEKARVPYSQLIKLFGIYIGIVIASILTLIIPITLI